MSLSLQVNGAAEIWTGTGAAYALEFLGISVDGVDISTKLITRTVKVDTYLDATFDEQHSLEEGSISCRLVLWDETVLEKVQARGFGMTAGTMPAAGTLLVAGGYTYPVVVKSTPAGSGVYGNAPCHKFGNCYAVDAIKKHVGTMSTTVDLSFRALVPQQVSSSAGAVLYSFSCT